jgi:hypothetical protein
MAEKVDIFTVSGSARIAYSESKYQLQLFYRYHMDYGVPVSGIV